MLIFLFPYASTATSASTCLPGFQVDAFQNSAFEVCNPTSTSTCITAFQQDAFQSNAFEICQDEVVPPVVRAAVGRPSKRYVKVERGKSDRTEVLELLAAVQQRATQLQSPKKVVKKIRKVAEVAAVVEPVVDDALLNLLETAARAKSLPTLIAHLNLFAEQVAALKTEMDEEEMLALLLVA